MPQEKITTLTEESEKQKIRELTGKLIIDLVSGLVIFTALAFFCGC